jgi:hypothetical protein
MQMKRLLVTMFTVVLMIFSSAEIVNFLPATLKGRVVDGRSGKPVQAVHVYITKGEEEIFSNSKGEFLLKTWQQLPVTVTVEHKNYKQQTVRISNETDQLTISLLPIQ